MAKYTPEQLKEMAEESICSYNLGEPQGSMLVTMLASMYRVSPDVIVAELHKFCNI